MVGMLGREWLGRRALAGGTRADRTDDAGTTRAADNLASIRDLPRLPEAAVRADSGNRFPIIGLRLRPGAGAGSIIG